MSDLEVARYAVRTWNMSLTHLELQSVAVSGSFWKDGVCEAKCYRRSIHGGIMRLVPSGHVAPFEGCQCGIYGSLSLDHLDRQYYEQTKFIVGVIAAEGQTLIGPRGLRTERARCVAYWTPDLGLFRNIAAKALGAEGWQSSLERMLADYHIPIHPESDSGAPYRNNYEFWNGRRG